MTNFYLQANPLLRETLTPAHIAARGDIGPMVARPGVESDFGTRPRS